MKGYLAELEKKSYLYLDPPPRAAGFRGAEGEATTGVEFPFVAPGTIDETTKKGKDKDSKATEAEAEGAEEREIERDLEEIEEEAPPENDEPSSTLSDLTRRALSSAPARPLVPLRPASVAPSHLAAARRSFASFARCGWTPSALKRV